MTQVISLRMPPKKVAAIDRRAADSGVGPFYCPGDAKVYIDLSFYEVMERKLNAPGDFARAYVLAHEVGHHFGLSDEQMDAILERAD